MAYNKKIEVQRLGEEWNWETLTEVWADVRTLSGTERWNSGERIQENVVLFKVRSSKLLESISTTDYRIKYGDKYFDIISVDDMRFIGSPLSIRTTVISPLVFRDGELVLHRITNTAAKGDKPSMTLTEIRTERFNYEQRENNDTYTAMQPHAENVMTVRIPLSLDISALDAVILSDMQYEIKSVSHDKTTVLPSTKLTLSRLEVSYETA